MIRSILGGCWLKELWYLPRNISGHDWDVPEYEPDAWVEVLRCKNCGEYSITWGRK